MPILGRFTCSTISFGHYLAVVTEDLDAFEWECPRGMGARREARYGALLESKHHSEVVEFVVDVRPSYAFDDVYFAHEEPAHVQEMERGFVQEASGDGRVRHPRGVLELTAVHLDVGGVRCYLPGGYELAGVLINRGKPPVQANLVHPIRLLNGIEDERGLRERRGHRFLREHVDAGAKRRDNGLQMSRVRRGDIQGVDALGEQIVERGVSLAFSAEANASARSFCTSTTPRISTLLS